MLIPDTKAGLILICAAFGASLAAAQEFRAGTTGTGKPYLISAAVREEYDSNVGTTSSNEDGSWVTSVSPQITFDYPMDNTVISAGYRFDARFYHQRNDGDKQEEFGHDFHVDVDHDFTDRLSVSLRENFRFDQESELQSAGTTRRLGGDHIRNTAGLQGTMVWTDRFSTMTSYDNTLYHYNQDLAAQVNDYTSHAVGQDFIFQVIPTTSAVASYSFRTYNYDDIQKDFDTHFFTVGADHYLLPEWLVSGRIGGQYTTYGLDGLSSQAVPYGMLRTRWNYLERSYVSAGYTYGTVVTDDANYATVNAHTLELQVVHYFTPRFSVGGQVEVRFTEYSEQQALFGSNSNEIETIYNINASYDFTNWLSANVGYRYSGIESEDLYGREYYRNQYYLGVTGRY